MSLHKLTAGDGYTYLTQQVAAQDSTELGRAELADYYSHKGESPGRWMGAALEDLRTVAEGAEVTEAQMKALFGEGRHPDADTIEASAVAEGLSATQVVAASQLGRTFRAYETNPSGFIARLRQRYDQVNATSGLPRDWPIPSADRARIRTELGRETFAEAHGRAPADDRELSGHLARVMRPQQQSTAGFDLTFSPVKSVSTLWAIAPREVSEQIEQAQEAAVADVIGWLERDVAYTREGTDGVQQVDVTGLVAGAFTHRDSRAGDPDLHTHIAVSNKVRAAKSGKWLALDGQVLYKAAVAASERYNTRLEREVQARLGVQFVNRDDSSQRRVVREIEGISPELMASWSSRRIQIDQRRIELAKDFQDAHGRTPTAAESLKLAQQATLDTREGKHEPRSLADQRSTWISQAAQVLGGADAIKEMLAATLDRSDVVTHEPAAEELDAAVERIQEAIEGARATWQVWHVRAEAERQARALSVPLATVDAVTQQLVDWVLHGKESVPLARGDGLREPSALRRADGASVYTKAGSAMFTSRRVQAAETTLMAAAQRHDGRTVSDTVVDLALLEQAANGHDLNPAQTHMVRELATSGARLQVVLAPAGSGKTTAMSVLSRAWRDGGGTVVGMAPSAVAAAALRAEIDTDTDTLAKLVWSLKHNKALPEWASDIDHRCLIIIDEAGMAGTADLATAVDFMLGRGASVRLVGDDQQLAAVAAGGALRDIAEEVGAVTLSELMRFSDPNEAAATLSLRAGDTAAVGFYLDHKRVHVTPADGAAHAVFAAWVVDHDADRSALMLAPTRDLVVSLNEQARQHRIAHKSTEEIGHTVRLRDGLHASAGDRILTRRNNRRLRITGTDWVKNGDQWIVEQVHDDHSLSVTHVATNRSLRLPADYVAADVMLGYACTIHGAQGLTVDACHTVLTGTESRQLAYVAMSRGRHTNHIYVPVSGDGDGHGMIRPETVEPSTAAETLVRVIGRDGAQRSARTQRREQNSPQAQLRQAATRYADAVVAAAVDQTSQAATQAMAEHAEARAPGITTAPAWDTLAARLALIGVSGENAASAFDSALRMREIDTADDPAAVVEWRLRADPNGPLPWLPGIPEKVKHHDTWGPYLQARFDLVKDTAAEVSTEIAALKPSQVPDWARLLVDSPAVLLKVALWRAAQDVSPSHMSPTGPLHPAVTHREYQQQLEQAVLDVTVLRLDGASTWKDFLRGYDGRVLNDPYWPVLAERLSIAAAAGVNVRDKLVTAAAEGPLPDEHAAAALWWRVNGMLTTSAGVDAVCGEGSSRLRPHWSAYLQEALGAELANRVMADAAWPLLVGAVHTASQDGPTPYALLDHAVGCLDLGAVDTPAGIPRSAIATVLTWRVHELREPPAGEPTELEDGDLSAEDAQFMNEWAAECAEPGDNNRPADLTFEPSPDDPGIGHLEQDSPEDDLSPQTRRERIIELNEQAMDIWANAYRNSTAATYLRHRLGTDLTDDTRFPVGYAPPGWTNLTDQLRLNGASNQELVDAGLGKYSRRGTVIDVFRDRLIFGIDHEGDLVGFTGRASPGSTGDIPKYLNTPATESFTKGAVLFGFDSGRDLLSDGGTAVLVEGALDAIATTLAGQGQYIGLAPMGTAFTARQADMLANQDQVIVATDADSAGRASARKAFDLLVDRGTNPLQVAFPDGADPASLDPVDLAARLEDPQALVTGLTDDIAAVLSASAHGGRPSAPERVWGARASAAHIATLPTGQWEEHVHHTASVFDLAPGSVMDCVLYAALDWDPLNPEPSSAPGAEPVSKIQNKLTPGLDTQALLRQRLAALRGDATTVAEQPAPAHQITRPTTPARGPHIG